MISNASRPYIDASVPVLREHGLAITTTFYASMFAAHPELKNLFNMGNQASGAQQQSLASAVFAYAANIGNAAALGPVVSRIVGRLDFTSMFLVLSAPPPGTPMNLEALKKAGVPVLAWGSFVTVAVNFLILAFVIFVMVKQVNRLRRHQQVDAGHAAEPVPPPEDIQLLREIRDSLQAKA